MTEENRQIRSSPLCCIRCPRIFDLSPLSEQRRSRFPKAICRGLTLILATWMALVGCQPAAVIRSTPEGEVAPGDEIVEILRSRESSMKGLRGVADLRLSTPGGLYRGKEVLSLELPDRLRVESLNFLGLEDLVLCSDGQRMDLFLPSERQIIRAKPTPEVFRRISGARVEPSQVLRILMGHPPLPVDGDGTSCIFLAEGRELPLVVERGGAINQRLWLDERLKTVRRGELLDEEGVWLSFECTDYREVGGDFIPFSSDIQLRRERVRLQFTYREVRINPSFASDAFRLNPPSLEGLTILDLDASEGMGELGR